MKALRPSAVPSTRPLFSQRCRAQASGPCYRQLQSQQQTRPFLQNLGVFASSEPQTLSVSRTLNYPSRSLYNIIADVSQYSSFVPFCQRSTVTRWSSQDISGEKWPEQATLVVGWRDIQEKFQSRVYCVPGKVVEALSGTSKTSLAPGDIQHHVVSGPSAEGDEGPFESLRTRWSVHPTQNEGSTEVKLAIEYKFGNPIYNALSAAAEDKIASMMIDAFEKRVIEVLGRPER